MCLGNFLAIVVSLLVSRVKSSSDFFSAVTPLDTTLSTHERIAYARRERRSEGEPGEKVSYPAIICLFNSSRPVVTSEISIFFRHADLFFLEDCLYC